jgi:hypothetical protein
VTVIVIIGCQVLAQTVQACPATGCLLGLHATALKLTLRKSHMNKTRGPACGSRSPGDAQTDVLLKFGVSSIGVILRIERIELDDFLGAACRAC